MLKGVHPLIGPQLLATLARMGHGDLLLVVDRNYPAYAAAVPVHRIDGVGAVAAIEAVLTLLPIDDFIDAPMLRMGPVENPAETTPVQTEAHMLVERVRGAASR
jgi:L-fucose mutarotase